MLMTIFKIFCVGGVVTILCLLYGFLIEPKILKQRDVQISSSNYKGEPLRIALVSDFHIGGRHVPASRVANIVARLNELDVDFVFMPGDFVSGSRPRTVRPAKFTAEFNAGLEYLAGLKSKKGIFATIGNHDVMYDAQYIAEKLREMNITVLENEAVNLEDGVCIVGLADHDTQTPDAVAFANCELGHTPLALMHSPDSFSLLRADTALAVAGHTHGGQINLPFIGRAVTATSVEQKYAYGLLDVKGIAAFVTSGIGTSILPARFRSPPEIVLITLSSQTAAQP